MTTKMSKALLGVAALAGLGATAYGCAIIGTVDFSIKFRTPAGVVINCAQASLTNVKFQFFDQALNDLLRTEVVRVCQPSSAEERYRVSIDLGPYLVKVQGLDQRQSICYASDVSIRVEGGRTDTYDLVAVATGGDCQYPQ
jgi:hypothetical protein